MEQEMKRLSDFLIGGFMTTCRAARKDLVGKEKEIIALSLLPRKTTSGWVWLRKYARVDVYKYLGQGPFGSRVYGWEFLENRKLNEAAE